MAAITQGVIYCGVGASRERVAEKVGGFVTGARMVVESRLFDHTLIHFSPCTSPGDGSLLWRFVEDCRRWHRALRAHPGDRLVLLQVGYYRSTFRELALARMARLAGRRVVLDVRGGAVLDFLDRGSGPLTRALFRRLVEGADLVLVQCSGLLPELRRRYPKARFDWFPNFVPASRCTRRAAAHHAAGEPLRAVYFGSYARSKGILEMLEAITRLRREESLAVELHLAGTGQDAAVRRAIEAAAGEGVIDHGPLDQEALWTLLDGMHVFLFPTSHFGEGHSNALNEAMMRGLAVVATRHNQNPHVLPPTVTRWLDAAHLVSSIQQELRYLAAHPEELDEAAQTNQRWVAEHFTDERWIPFLEARFDDVLAGREI